MKKGMLVIGTLVVLFLSFQEAPPFEISELAEKYKFSDDVRFKVTSKSKDSLQFIATLQIYTEERGWHLVDIDITGLSEKRSKIHRLGEGQSTYLCYCDRARINSKIKDKIIKYRIALHYRTQPGSLKERFYSQPFILE